MRGSYKLIVGIGVVVLLIAAGFGGWLLGNGGDDDEKSAAKDEIRVGVPVIVSPAELKEFAGDHEQVYWAGERSGTHIELTLTARNGIFVRYLPENVKAGSKGTYLTVATYSAVEGYQNLVSAKKSAAEVTRTQSGAVVAVFKKQPLSTYFAFPDGAFQIEVYSPTKGESEKLVSDGTVALLGNSP